MKQRAILLLLIIIGSTSINQAYSQAWSRKYEEYKASLDETEQWYKHKSGETTEKLISLADKKKRKGLKATDISPVVQWYANSKTDTMIYITSLQKVGTYYDQDSLCVPGKVLNTSNYVLWFTIPNEFNKKLLSIGEGLQAKDSITFKVRLAEVLGLPISETEAQHRYKVFTFKVAQSKVLRPAFNPDPNINKITYSPSNSYSSQVWENYEKWLTEKWQETFPNADADSSNLYKYYPFTGLGYTYDWGSEDNNNHYGLSEFIIIEKSDFTFVSCKALWDYYIDLQKKHKKRK
ncbi:MAG: hypothetical protein R3Y26_11080 [Rikenellaceae bacterium]